MEFEGPVLIFVVLSVRGSLAYKMDCKDGMYVTGTGVQISVEQTRGKGHAP